MTRPIDRARPGRAIQRRPAVVEQPRHGPRRTTPAVKPADRSISPSSSTKTRPIAMIDDGAPWVNRLAKLPAPRGSWRRGDDAEDDEQHDEAEDRRAATPCRRRGAGRRRRGALAAASTCSRVDAEVGSDGARGGGAGVVGGVSVLAIGRSPQTWTCSTRCRPRSPVRPAVISSTTWVCVGVGACTWRPSRPR